jgi:2-methylcitrate dehydratase PrpD
MAFAPLIHVMPNAPLEGKFSLHYCIAAALVDGAVGLSSFTDAKIADPAIRALITHISMEIDEDLRGNSEFATRVTVETMAGARIERFVPLAMGKPDRWFDVQRMREKFSDCSLDVLGEGGCEEAFATLRALDGVMSIERLIHALRPRAAAAQPSPEETTIMIKETS